MIKLSEKADVKKVVKDLQGNFGGSNEEQMAGVQLIKGLATSDEKIANEFMNKLNTATTKISKEVLGGKEEVSESTIVNGDIQIGDKILEKGDRINIIKKNKKQEMISPDVPAQVLMYINARHYGNVKQAVDLKDRLQKELGQDFMPYLMKFGDPDNPSEGYEIVRDRWIDYLGSPEVVSQMREGIKGSSTHLEAILKNLFKPFGVKVKWTVDSIEIEMPNADWYWNEFSASGKLEEFNGIMFDFGTEYDVVDDTIVIYT